MRFRLRWQSPGVRTAVLIAAVLGVVLLFVIGLQYGLQVGSGPGLPPPGDPVAEPPVPADPPVEEPDEPESPACPLDGEVLGVEPPDRRPLAIVVDNNPGARPQDGLDQACLVYEVPVEGGMTRFIALYYHQDAPLVGPVRSARDYMIDFARAHDAVFCHIGGSPGAYELFHTVDNLDELAGAPGYWRADHRRPPYNLYTRTSLLWDEAERRGWISSEHPGGGLVFSSELPAGEPAADITIGFSGGGYVVRYLYEELTGRYLRFIGTSAHRDASTGLQLEAATVIIQLVDARPIPDDPEGRLSVKLVGQGTVLLARGGELITGYWHRAAGSLITRYLDEDGHDIELMRGGTWILIVPDRSEVTYK